MKQRLLSFFLLALLVFSLIPSFTSNVNAGTLSGNHSMGYELLDSGAVFHMWNKFDDYYFNTSSGIQLTNHYSEYWTQNVMLLGYYTGSTWNIIYRTDELSGFSWSIDTDNSNYINVTGYRDLTYAGYSFRLAIRYYLATDSQDLTVIPYIKDLGIDIPYTLAFGWEIKDIKINNLYADNQIRINDTSYLLNQPLDKTYNNITKTIYNYNETTHVTTSNKVADPIFYLDYAPGNNIRKTLYLKWDASLNYLVTVKSRDGQYNAPTTLFIKIGTLNSNQEKYTYLHWWDSDTLFEHFNTGYNGGYKIYGVNWAAQTFTPSIAHNITSVKLLLQRTDTPGTLNIYIETTDDSGKPTGSVLTSGTTNGDTLPTTPPEWREITLTSCRLDTGTKYAIVAKASGGDYYDNVYWCANTSASGYANGDYCWYADGPWYLVNTKDFMFEEYGTTVAPMNLAVSWFNYSRISMTWNKGTNNTVLVRKYTGYPTNPSDGIKVYNGTAQTYIDTGLQASRKYYYRAWNWRTGIGYSSGYTSVNQTTRPKIPTNPHFTTLSASSINITWTKGGNATKTVIRKSTTTQPLTPWDGTELYNGTASYKVDTAITGTFYDTLFMYNTTTKIFSNPGVNLSTYFVWVNCYKELDGSKITNYTVFFSNNLGTWTFIHFPCNNPYLINVSSIPQGNDISLIVNRTGYKTRTYSQDIIITGNYYINTYLITNNTIYLLTVSNPSNQPISNAKIAIERYINATVGFQSVSIAYTDGAGQMTIFLQPFKQYKFFITHSGYQPQISDWTPSDQLFTHTFMMQYEQINLTLPVIEPTITGYINSSSKMLYVNYTDVQSNTTDVQIYVYLYDYTTDTSTLVNSSSYTANNDIHASYLLSNLYYSYIVNVFYNHTNLGSQEFTIVFPGNQTKPITTPSKFNLLFTANYGFNPFGWSNTVCWLILLMIYFEGGQEDVGFILIVAGAILFFINYWIGFYTSMSVLMGGGIPALHIILGAMWLWYKGL